MHEAVRCTSPPMESIFENGDTPLHVAVRVTNHKLILYLLTNGLSPNDRNQKTGDTSMHEAVQCTSQRDRILAIMLKFHGDSQIKNNDGKSALDLALEKGDKDVA